MRPAWAMRSTSERWRPRRSSRLGHAERRHSERRRGGRSMSRYVGAIDQGTTSSRFIVFDKKGEIVSVAQKEHRQIYPKPGWVEHDPVEIMRNTDEMIGAALARANLGPTDLAAIGITNQRETTVL